MISRHEKIIKKYFWQRIILECYFVRYFKTLFYLVNTSSVLALELILAALLLRDVAVGHDRAVLIGTVNAIRISVADPLLGNAHGAAPLLVSGTLELGLGVTSAGIYNKKKR